MNIRRNVSTTVSNGGVTDKNVLTGLWATTAGLCGVGAVARCAQGYYISATVLSACAIGSTAYAIFNHDAS